MSETLTCWTFDTVDGVSIFLSVGDWVYVDEGDGWGHREYEAQIVGMNKNVVSVSLHDGRRVFDPKYVADIQFLR